MNTPTLQPHIRNAIAASARAVRPYIAPGPSADCMVTRLALDIARNAAQVLMCMDDEPAEVVFAYRIRTMGIGQWATCSDVASAAVDGARAWNRAMGERLVEA